MILVGREVKDRVDSFRDAQLEDLHLQTVGLKVWATEHGVRDVEVARLSCGGHGKSCSLHETMVHSYYNRKYGGCWPGFDVRPAFSVTDV